MIETEYKRHMSQNRSTLYHFFKDNNLMLKYMKIGKGSYKVFQVPYDWDHSYLLINDMKVTDFQAVILFTNELVIRFSKYDDWQINIPYKSIKTISVTKDLYVGYNELHLNK